MSNKCGIIFVFYVFYLLGNKILWLNECFCFMVINWLLKMVGFYFFIIVFFYGDREVE